MILGVYWYFDFPYDLYSYNFFTFHKGLGGHADAPAELITTVETEDADLIIAALRVLVDQYTEAFLFIYKSGNMLQIGTGGYNMHDYDFELALKIEQILQTHKAQKVLIDKLADAEFIRLSGNNENTIERLSKKYFQLVGSSLKKHNAETSSIRFDCNVGVDRKEAFLEAMMPLTESCSIHVIYYLESKCSDRYNLMLFFTNGRQGVGLAPKQHVDVAAFENGMDVLIQKYNVQTGHIAGAGIYPAGKPIVLKIIDAAYIVG